ncbi:hypothetical protein Taro_054950 [Colocasia esculenta]|uniref:Uncharacterized protein n=1 Tax=Colocasia esculenta TaxID=4460 RepID=A0A843XRW0_COLES|nr:hypothetical protein [Colocasia esculenta]
MAVALATAVPKVSQRWPAMAHLNSECNLLMNRSVRAYLLAATRQKTSEAEDEETSPEAPCGPRVLPLQLESAAIPLGVPLAEPVLPAGSAVAAPLLPSLRLLTSYRHLLILPRTLEHRSPPLLHDGRWGLGQKPLLLLLWLSLPQRNALRQRVPRLLELLGLSVD